MFKRFTNPHLTNIETTGISRKDLDFEDHPSLDEEAINELHSRLADEFEELQPPRKRRKHNSEHVPEVTTDPLPFHLFSTHEPQTIDLKVSVRLLSPSHKVVVSIEPSREDTEEQAEERRRKALAAAIDPVILLNQAQMMTREEHNSPIAPMLLLEISQPARKTRPPVDPRHLIYHPYSPSGKPSPNYANTVKACPSISLPGSTESKKRHRKSRLRPQPTFWKPPPTLRNKCMGYAMGYPSSWGKYDK